MLYGQELEDFIDDNEEEFEKQFYSMEEEIALEILESVKLFKDGKFAVDIRHILEEVIENVKSTLPEAPNEPNNTLP